MNPPAGRNWQLHPSAGFVDWLAEWNLSLLVTTYQVGKLLLLGVGENGQLSVVDRTFPRAMGVWTNSETIWLATAHQVWRLESQFDGRTRRKGFDRLFVPRVAYTTGDLDLHDISIDYQRRPIFVATLFNCLATVSAEQSFAEVWRPPFIDEVTAQDRCHLNGLAMVEGEPRYVSVCALSNERKGWKTERQAGGAILDVPSGEVVARGFSMPHSPRWHDQRLWLLNSGRGELGYLDLPTGEFQPVAFCPGYARGLDFAGHFAIVGLSRPREENRFGGLELDAGLASRGLTAMSGLQVVDLRSGEVAHALEIKGKIAELYDVAVIRGVQRPSAMGLGIDALRANVWTNVDGRNRHWRGSKG